MLEIISVSLAILTGLATLWSAAFLQGRFSPNIDLRIRPVWPRSNQRLMKLIIELENLGSIRVGLERVLLVVKEFHFPTSSQPAECIGAGWIDFNDAEQILKTTTHINPREVLHVERLYDPGEARTLHIGLQVYLRFPWYINLLGAQARSRRQTRTFFVSGDLNDSLIYAQKETEC